MRSFSKKLAFVLAAAMVVTTFAPAASAEAAKEMAINKSSKILYVTDGSGINDAAQVGGGKGNVSSYDFSVKNKPADWKTTLSFKWTSSNEDVATVENGGLVTAVSAGKATISCKITDKATGEVVTTAKTKVTVKKNAAEVVISNADDYDGTVVEVNGVVDLNRTMYDVDGTKTTKRGTVVTDYTKWVAEPAAGVEIDQKSGKFTFTEAAEAGEYKLYCYTYQSSKYQDATATSDAVVVEFQKGNELEIVQTTKTAFKLSFRTAVDALAAADVTVDRLVVGANNTVIKVNNLVKSVTLSDDKKSATVELYNEFVNANEYQITVKGFDMATITASVGAPASIVLSSSKYYVSNTVIADGNASEIYARLYDANGVDVTATENGNEQLTFQITYTTNGYTYDGSFGNSLYFTTAGDSAVVVATYHSNEYDNEGNEVGKVVSAPFTFVGVDKSYVGIVGVDSFSLGGEGSGVTNIKMDSSIGENQGKELGIKFKLADGNATRYITFGNDIVDKDGNDLNIGTLSFKSLNTDILEVVDGVVYPYKTGKTQVMAYANKDGKETAIAAVTIEVLNWTGLGSLNFSSTRVVVSAGASENIDDPVIYITSKDQYGDVFNKHEVYKISAESDVAKAAVDASAIGFDQYTEGEFWTDGNNEKINVRVSVDVLKAIKAQYAPNANSMAFKFNVHVRAFYAHEQEIVTPIVVELREATGTAYYDIEATGLADTNVARRFTNDGNTKNTKSVTFNLYQMKNSAKVDVQTFEPIPENGVTGATGGVFYYKLTRNGASITADATGDGLVTINFTDAANGIVNTKNAAGSEDRGAGVYEITVYEGTAAGKWKAVASERVSVTYDAGAYSFTGRRAVKANSIDQADILACFGFKNKEGKEMSAYTVNDFGDSIDRTYDIAMKDYAYQNGVRTMFVEKVTFFENVGDAKVEYVVWVNQSVQIAE